jgi:esterase
MIVLTMALLNFQQLGQQSTQTNNIILIHGLFGSMDNLNMIARALAKNYCVINIDVRNHGYSFHKNSMSYSELAQDVIDLLNHLNITKTAILGHSMGGKIAMQIALEYSERISKLIVADIAPVTYPNHHQQIIEGLKAIDLSKVHNRKDADSQLAAYVENVGVRQFLLRNLTKTANKTESKNSPQQFHFACALNFISDCYAQIMQGYLGEQNFTGQTLFIKGGDSDYISQQHRSIILKLFPNSKAKIIAGAGHWLHAEKTVAFNKIVTDFLAHH